MTGLSTKEFITLFWTKISKWTSIKISKWTSIKAMVDNKLGFLPVVLVVVPILTKAIVFTENTTKIFATYIDVSFLKNAFDQYKDTLQWMYFGALFLVIARFMYKIFAPPIVKKFNDQEDVDKHYLGMFEKAKAAQLNILANHYLRKVSSAHEIDDDSHEIDDEHCSNKKQITKHGYFWEKDHQWPFIRTAITLIALIGVILLAISPLVTLGFMLKSWLFSVFSAS